MLSCKWRRFFAAGDKGVSWESAGAKIKISMLHDTCAYYTYSFTPRTYDLYDLYDLFPLQFMIQIWHAGQIDS